MKKNIYTICLFFSMSVAAQNVPKTGADTTLEIANWNLQWFGSTTYGPTDESLQLGNIAAVIQKSDMDIWGLIEVSSPGAWDALLIKLPQYHGVISTWSQTQKTALLFKKSQFRMVYAQHVLPDYYVEFAGGRLPLEVMLEYNNGNKKDSLRILVIHLKSNVGSAQEKAESWDRRRKCGDILKAYLDTVGRHSKCMVIGDWNDDLDSSVLPGYATPFANLLADSTHYYFTTRPLTLSGERTMAAYTEVIDHQCVTKQLRDLHLKGSSSVFYLQNHVVSYATTTSDHYPVYSKYRVALQTLSVQKPQFISTEVYFDGNKIQFRSIHPEPTYEVYDTMGRKVSYFKPGQILVVKYTHGSIRHTARVVVPE